MRDRFGDQALDIGHVRSYPGIDVPDFLFCKKTQRNLLQVHEQVLSHAEQNPGGIARIYIAVEHSNDKTEHEERNKGRQKGRQKSGIISKENFVDEYLRKIGLNHTQSRAEPA